jgi:hypothetical protein
MKMPHLMAGSIFNSENRCNHWSERVQGVVLSSMFYLERPKNRQEKPQKLIWVMRAPARERWASATGNYGLVRRESKVT